jgi:hypothetical protein
MSHTIDFAELKERVNIEQAADMLGIKLRNCFGKCGKGAEDVIVSNRRALAARRRARARAASF